MVRSKHVLFGLVFVMMAYVLVHNERFLVEPGNPFRAHFATYGWWIVAHGVAGAVAMFLAPLQFSERLRARYATLHHIVGYLYVGGILLLAPMGVYVQYIGEALHGFPRSFTVLAVVNAVMLWVVTSVALVFFEGRFILGVTGLESGSVEIVQAVIWGCLAMSVILTDVVNDWAEIRRSTVTAATASARERAPGRVVVASSV